MKPVFVLRLVLFVTMLGIATQANAAELIDGQLWLEIFLDSGTQITMKSRDARTPSFTITEIGSPISKQVEGNLKLSFMNWDKLPFWGLLNRVEPLTAASDDGDFAMRQSYNWIDGKLALKKEKLIFEPDSFNTQATAQRYAEELGIPRSQVQAIPMLNATVKVLAGNNEHYFETPLRIKSDRDIQIGGLNLAFGGEFVIKAIGEKLVITHFLTLENYVGGVIQNEIGSNAPLEALKTQAIAARTHAVSLLLYNRHQGDGYDLCNSTHCQVYKGQHLSNANIITAVQATEHEVLISNGRIADATYHSACGGKTDSSANIWKGAPISHLMGVTCIEAADSLDLSTESGARLWLDSKLNDPEASNWEKSSLQWKRDISRTRLASNLGLTKLSKIEIIKRGHSGRILQMRFTGSKTVTLDSEYKIRQAFGGLPSSFFYIASSGSTIVVKGKGAGHGVGMCQIGVLRLARSGWSYPDILSMYYPGTLISKDWMPQ